MIAKNLAVAGHQWATHASVDARLADMRLQLQQGRSWSLSLCRDLIELDLAQAEKALLLRLADSGDGDVFEAFLLEGMGRWDPNLASSALREWARRTDRRRRGELISFVTRNALIPQRVFYTLLEILPSTDGQPLLDALIRHPRRPQLAVEIQALAFLRAVQWGKSFAELDDEAGKLLRDAAVSGESDKVLRAAMEYLARFHPLTLASFLQQPAGAGPLADLAATLYQSVVDDGLCESVAASLGGLADGPNLLEGFPTRWPPTWNRARLGLPSLRQCLRVWRLSSATKNFQGPALDWTAWAGVDAGMLRALLLEVAGIERQALKRGLGGLLPSVGGPARTLASIVAPPSDDPGRTACFDQLFRGSTETAELGVGPWSTLAAAINAPDKVPPRDLHEAGRHLAGPLRQVYYQALGRYKGRSDVFAGITEAIVVESDENLPALIEALADIDSPYSHQYLLKIVESDDVSVSGRLDAAQRLGDIDLSAHQGRIREVLARLKGPGLPLLGRTDRDLVDAVATLLDRTALPQSALPEFPGKSGEKSLEDRLRKKIPSLGSLPIETVRALRTSLFFLESILESGAEQTLDVSPAVDMQYKALEILFKARVTPQFAALVADGRLRACLDLAGYTRGSQPDMEAFEAYLGSLPLIRDVPSFSRNKLNRLLRAVATYRPGRRFSFDGLKALALFLLAFGRRQCPYKLNGILTHTFADDLALFEFCRTLHILQDVRNLAVHEGLAAGATRDIQALWGLTNRIIEDVVRLQVGK